MNDISFFIVSITWKQYWFKGNPTTIPKFATETLLLVKGEKGKEKQSIFW
jgi:hypothetical protein